MNNNKTTWSVRIAAFLGGIAICALLSGSFGIDSLTGILTWAYEKIGITIVALIPLGTWSIWAALKAKGDNDITLAYIGTTAQRVGLLGTVIGIVAATIRIGDGLSSGAAGAVTSALPAVGQALVSTAVGFVIAIICDFFRYLNSDSNPKNKSLTTG